MEYDEKLIDDAVLALLVAYVTDLGNFWKGYDFETLKFLHEQNFIGEKVFDVRSSSSNFRH